MYTALRKGRRAQYTEHAKQTTCVIVGVLTLCDKYHRSRFEHVEWAASLLRYVRLYSHYCASADASSADKSWHYCFISRNDIARRQPMSNNASMYATDFMTSVLTYFSDKHHRADFVRYEEAVSVATLAHMTRLATLAHMTILTTLANITRLAM